MFNIANDAAEKNDVKEDHWELFGKLKAKLAELAGAAMRPNIPPNRAPQGFKVPKVWGESN